MKKIILLVIVLLTSCQSSRSLNYTNYRISNKGLVINDIDSLPKPNETIMTKSTGTINFEFHLYDNEAKSTLSKATSVYNLNDETILIKTTGSQDNKKLTEITKQLVDEFSEVFDYKVQSATNIQNGSVEVVMIDGLSWINKPNQVTASFDQNSQVLTYHLVASDGNMRTSGVITGNEVNFQMNPFTHEIISKEIIPLDDDPNFKPTDKQLIMLGQLIHDKHLR